ncbi:ribosomal protein S5 domain 2-like protein [Ramicandelaber brevisporus]|nr:ribosomal protein S5 domain 2-like protein [Ramicandelaber brevisporus]
MWRSGAIALARTLPATATATATAATVAQVPSLGVPRDVFNSLTKRVLHVHRTVNMTRKGKIQSMYAMVVVGNGNGLAGYGEGKNTDLAKAVQKAVMAAVKNMVPIPRYDARTIQHDIEHKFKATQLQMWAKRPGFGVRANPHVHEICKCAGIHDVAAKVHRSRNPMNVVKATFEALLAQRTPEEIARARGRKLTDVYKTYYGVI